MRPYLKPHDVFEKSSCLNGTLTAFQWIWLLFFIASTVLVINANFEVSICNPGGGECTGNVYTDQWSSIGWIAMCIFGGVHVFFLCGYQMNLIFGRNRICSIIWITLMLVTWFVFCIGCFLIISEAANCNRPGYPSNTCSSLERCLVPEFFNDPFANRCPNSPFGFRAYTLQLSDLQPTQDFKWLFGAYIGFVFFDFVFLLLVVILWCGVLK
jgi:hypothetical protein